MIRFIDLFGGIGGFRLGLENVCETEEGRGFKCVGYYEINKYCVQVYNHRFKETHQPTDVTTVDAEDIPDHDLLCSGFPCQSFSIAGRRKGFQDTRGTLFFEICRILKEKRPRLCLLENVRGLLSADDGRCFHKILLSLDELGYDAEWQIFNTKYYLPQNRERVFIIGHLREGGGCSREIFPIRQGVEVSGGDYSEEQGERELFRSEGIVSTIDSGYGALRNSGETYIRELKQIAQVGKHDNMGQRIYSIDGIATAIRAEGGRQGAKTGLYAIPLRDDLEGVRRLTPLECERVQGFPDEWTRVATKNNDAGEKFDLDDEDDTLIEGAVMSDTQRYKMIGNAVSVPVITSIGRKLLGVHDG